MTLLTDLRSLRPDRPLTMREAYGVAERQATRLLSRTNVDVGPVPAEIISELSFVQVEARASLPASGATRWIKPRWVILLNAYEPLVRQRFSLAHEFKHLLDHPFVVGGHMATDTATARAENERLCDYFAACLLMPRPWVKRAWTSGHQDVVALADEFVVSAQAMHVRLTQVGLIDRYSRHSEIDNTYFRTIPALPLGLAA